MIQVFYHRDFDGIASAYMLSKILVKDCPELETCYTSVQYGEDIKVFPYEEVIYFVDFTPKNAVEIAKMQSLSIIDHHMTDENQAIKEALRKVDYACMTLEPSKGACTLVPKKLAPMTEVPEAIKLIGARDVWDFSDPRTKPFNAFLEACAPDIRDYQLWFNLLDHLLNGACFDNAVNIGTMIQASQDKKVESILKNATQSWFGNGKENVLLWSVNSTTLHSEIGSALVKEHGGVACVWSVAGTELRMSFRSADGTAATTAKLFGGNGHDNAAGATLTDFQIKRCTKDEGRLSVTGKPK